MSAISQKFTIRRVVVLTLVLFWLEGCVNSSNTPMSMSLLDVSSSINNASHSGTLIVPLSKTNSMELLQTSAILLVLYSVTLPILACLAEQPVLYSKKHTQYNRQYTSIPKGSYVGDNTYTVKRGDTLFYIAWITRNNLYNLAQQNNIKAPYNLKVGQILQINNITDKHLKSSNVFPLTNIPVKKHSAVHVKKSTTLLTSRPVINNSENSSKQNAKKIFSNVKGMTSPVTAPMINSAERFTKGIYTRSPIFIWHWPTKGKVIETFSYSEIGNKGIDIAGSKGQDIVATANGRVVYVGNALRGYGNLIIIKHNDNYLSAYAHNNTMLVKEQQEIKEGQKIATMGNTGTSSTRLHFEIRYKGKPVNPLLYLKRK